MTRLILTAALAAAACGGEAPVETARPAAREGEAEPGASAAWEAAATNACPIVASRDWTARVEDGRLIVEGEIDTPTPGWTIGWREGAADRSAVPTVRLILEAEPPGGMTAQVITSQTVRYDGPAVAARYRGVLILCGGAPIAEIAGVS